MVREVVLEEVEAILADQAEHGHRVSGRHAVPEELQAEAGDDVGRDTRGIRCLRGSDADEPVVRLDTNHP
jgi:hypothetical protein